MVHSTVNHRIHSLKCLDVILPTLKKRTVFALPVSHAILLLSHVKRPLSLCAPNQLPVLSPTSSSLGSWTNAAAQTTLPCHLSHSHELHLQTLQSLSILLQALAGCFWTKFQIISAKQFTFEISPDHKAWQPNTSQNCQKLVQADNTYSLLSQLEEAQE